MATRRRRPITSQSEQSHTNSLENLKNTHEIAIRQAIVQQDIPQLRRLARKGFLNNRLRRRVWPLLVGIDSKTQHEMNENNKKDKDPC